MKASDSKPGNLFNGRFKILKVYCKSGTGRWSLLKKYGRNSFVWEFREDKSLLFPSGTIVYEGVLREGFGDFEGSYLKYAYYPEDRQLHIGGYSSVAKSRSGTEQEAGSHYRIEKTGRTSYRLYDLDGVDKEPGDYSYRIDIKRVRMPANRIYDLGK